MILAALEEMVGNEQNVRHRRIDSGLQKLAASISGSPFENYFFSTITNIRQFSFALFIHWQSVDDMRELVKLVPDYVRLSMPLQCIGKAQLLPNHIPTCLYLAPPILLYQLAQAEL